MSGQYSHSNISSINSTKYFHSQEMTRSHSVSMKKVTKEELYCKTLLGMTPSKLPDLVKEAKVNSTSYRDEFLPIHENKTKVTIEKNQHLDSRQVPIERKQHLENTQVLNEMNSHLENIQVATKRNPHLKTTNVPIEKNEHLESTEMPIERNPHVESKQALFKRKQHLESMQV